MKFFRIHIVFLTILFCGGNGQLKVMAQDIRMSQYKASSMILNPALTGLNVPNGNKVTAQHRSQWGLLTSKFITTSFAYEEPIDKWKIGGYIVSTDAANLFSTFNFQLSAAHEITPPNNKRYKMSMGLQLGLIYKRTSNDRLVFDNQYQSGTFDPDLPTGENFNKYSITMPDVSYGIAYQNINKREKYKPYGGMALFHINSPKESFIDSDNSKLPIRYLFYGGTKIRLSKEFTVDPSILFMRQRKSMDINFGVDATYIINKKMTILAGLRGRLRDSFIPILGMTHKNVTYQLSYDINLSSLQTVSNKKGGMEFSIIFNGSKKPVSRINRSRTRNSSMSE